MSYDESLIDDLAATLSAAWDAGREAVLLGEERSLADIRRAAARAVVDQLIYLGWGPRSEIHHCQPLAPIPQGWVWTCLTCGRTVEAPIRWADIAPEPRRRWWKR